MAESEDTNLLKVIRDELNPELSEGLPAYVGAEIAEAEHLLDSDSDTRNSAVYGLSLIHI